MKEELHQKKHWLDRGWQSLLRATFNVAAPPIAGKYHRRYDRRRWLLFVDTLLTLLLFFLIVIGLYFLTSKQLLPAPVVEAALTAPEVITNGGRVEIDVRLSNNDTLTIGNIEVRMNFPAEFVFESASPEPSRSDSLIWEIPELRDGQTTHLKIFGHVVGAPNTQPSVKALVRYTSGDQPMSHSLAKTFTISGELISMILSAPETVPSGQEYLLTIQAVNNSEYELSNAAIEIKMPKEFIQASVTRPFEKGQTRWALNNLKPRSEWTIRISGSTTAAKNQASVFEIRAVILNNNLEFFQTTANETVNILGSSGRTETDTTTEAAATKLQFAAEAHYYSTSGVQFGYGPLPPKVGQITGYRVFWIIKNNGRAYQDITVESVLPAAATWAGNGSVSLGQPISYDNTTRKITWHIGALSGSQQYSTASFEVTINPGANDVGKTPTLCDETIVSDHIGTATQNVTTFPPLTTLVSESQAAGKGLVQK